MRALKIIPKFIKEFDFIYEIIKMCVIRRRIKSFFKQKENNTTSPSTNPLSKVEELKQQKFVPVPNANIYFKKQGEREGCSYLQKMRSFWTAYKLLILPKIGYLCSPFREQSERKPKKSEEQKTHEIHSLELCNQQNQYNIQEIKTTVSVECEGSTFGNTNSAQLQEILSISNSLISVRMEI